MLAGCPGTPGTRTSPGRGGRLWIQRECWPRPGRRDLAGGRRRRLMMDVENLLATASENLSVRRAFGTAYEKDGMLIIPVALVAGGGGGGTGSPRTRRGDSAARPGGPPAAGPAGPAGQDSAPQVSAPQDSALPMDSGGGFGGL